MDTENNKTIYSFSLKEKLYAQISFHGGVLTGAYGLSLVTFAAAYAGTLCGKKI